MLGDMTTRCCTILAPFVVTCKRFHSSVSSLMTSEITLIHNTVAASFVTTFIGFLSGMSSLMLSEIFVTRMTIEVASFVAAPVGLVCDH